MPTDAFSNTVSRCNERSARERWRYEGPSEGRGIELGVSYAADARVGGLRHRHKRYQNGSAEANNLGPTASRSSALDLAGRPIRIEGASPVWRG